MSARLILLPLVTLLAACGQERAGEVSALLERCGPLAHDEVRVEGGTARFGSDRGYADEGPVYEATIKGFWMDRHEVSNCQFAGFVAATGYLTEAEKAGESVVFDPPPLGEPPGTPAQWWKLRKGANWLHPEGASSSLLRRENLPVIHVSYADARSYALWRGRSLPSEEQFEYAARAGRPEGLEQPLPTQANTWQGSFPSDNRRADGHAGLAPVESFQPNPFGLYDLIGNAWEWTRSIYLPGHQAVAEPVFGNGGYAPEQPRTKVRVIKGGSFLCAPGYCARYRPEARHAQDETLGTAHLGFRTVREEDAVGLAARP